MTTLSNQLGQLGRWRLQRGFTIIELLISITILAILIAVAVPSLTDLISDQRVKNATFDVYASLTLARSEAIKRAANVDIVPTAAGQNNWASGWQVQFSGASLKSQDAISGAVSISGPASTFSYQRDGRIAGSSAPSFVVWSSQNSAITARCVRVDLSGRPNIKVDTNHRPADGCQ